MGVLDFEQRKNARVSLFQEILVQGPESSLRSSAADISVGGMFIDHTSPRVASTDLVTVRFSLSPDDGPVFVEAAVNYIQDGIGMGIRFLNLENGDKDRIAAYVDRILRRPVLQGQIHPRKSSRVSINVPVKVRVLQPDGAEVHEATQIVTLSKHGACVLVTSRMDIGAKLLLETGGREFRSSVVWIGNPQPTRTENQVGIQCRGLAQFLGFRFP